MVSASTLRLTLCVGAAAIAGRLPTTTAASFYPVEAWEVCGMDFIGNDLTSVPHTVPHVCAAICATYADCRAATWTNYQGGTCWLKKNDNARSSFQPNVNAISYIVLDYTQPKDAGCGWFERYDVDIPGWDIGNAPGKDDAVCQDKCIPNKACWGAVWTNFNGGTCWFKGRGNAFAPKAGAIACVMARRMKNWIGTCPVV